MPKGDDNAALTKLPNPSRFLLADETWEEFDARLTDLVEDLKPKGALEYRQVELILRCDLDIDRQYRLMAQHLNPLGETINQGAELIAEWHRSALAKLHGRDEGDEPPAHLQPFTMPEGDERLTPLIAKRYAGLRELMSLHQRELAAAHRRRRQEIAALHDLQERRRRSAVPDAKVTAVDV